MGQNVSDEKVEEMQERIYEDVSAYFDRCQELFDEQGWSYGDVVKLRPLSWHLSAETDGSVTSNSGSTEFEVQVTVRPSDQFKGEFVGFNVDVEVRWADSEEILKYWPNPAGDRWSRDLDTVAERLVRAPELSLDHFQD